MEDTTYTPEDLAWKLIMDENIDSSPIMAFSDENSQETLFEILITIYIEMITNYYKLKYLENTIEDDDENKINDEFENFKLDFTNVDIETLKNIFSEKFNKIKYILNVHEISRDRFEELKKSRYCTVLFRDLPSDSMYFEMNEQYIDPNKNYHFVLNSMYKQQDELRNIYCTINLNQKYYKISFMSLI